MRKSDQNKLRKIKLYSTVESTSYIDGSKYVHRSLKYDVWIYIW